MFNLINISHFLLILLINPKRTFNNIYNNKLTHEVYIVFSLSALITFLKSFFIKSQKIDYYSNEYFNDIFSILSLPQLAWLISYISFFIFIYLLALLINILYRKTQKKQLFLSIISISGLGLIFQLIFIPLNYFLRIDIIIFMIYFIFFIVSLYTVLAVKYSQNISLIKSIVLFIVASLPSLFLAGLSGIAPYLSWLNT